MRITKPEEVAVILTALKDHKRSLRSAIYSARSAEIEQALVRVLLVVDELIDRADAFMHKHAERDAK